MSYIPEEPPGENEAYESFDEALDGEDVSGPTPGPEGQRDLDSEIVADQTAIDDDPVDPELDIEDVDATRMDQVPDDAPGPDSARW